VTVAVCLAGSAGIFFLILFLLINKYGRRSKLGMKGKKWTGYISSSSYFQEQTVA
jgi:hypothetical protein